MEGVYKKLKEIIKELSMYYDADQNKHDKK